ncbi:MGDG synthase family glycosyltransferase [Metabacillus idriensis]|uniref:MGDG synthase family glycosyltransferase n=1 Tax=Metabacillus idriensis TaxID=324768 RepID=UPI003D26A132
MKRVLVLPLFQMESGHHRTADALIEAFSHQDPSTMCEKVDILDYASSSLEKFISQLYVNWITAFPSAYSWLYSSFFQKNKSLLHSIYETLFLEKMEQLIREKQPDVIICTHSFPSFLADKLKRYGMITAPVVNVYTDFFLNGVWGRDHIDMHIVSTAGMKQHLIEAGTDPASVKVSGIVTNDQYKKRKPEAEDGTLHILVSGGSLGLGDSLQSLLKTTASSKIKYKILCGHNQELLQQIMDLGRPNMTGISYITEAEQMNRLYNWADALITKPGGITVGEAIKKSLPVFVHSVLPGQEEKNMEYLETEGLARRLDPKRPIDQQLLSALKDEKLQFLMKKARYHFLKNIEIPSCRELADTIAESCLTDDPNVRFLDDAFLKVYQNL